MGRWSRRHRNDSAFVAGCFLPSGTPGHQRAGSGCASGVSRERLLFPSARHGADVPSTAGSNSREAPREVRSRDPHPTPGPAPGDHGSGRHCQMDSRCLTFSDASLRTASTPRTAPTTWTNDAIHRRSARQPGAEIRSDGCAIEVGSFRIVSGIRG